MQPVSLSASSQLPQSPSFDASLDNATPNMEGQNAFFSRSLSPSATAQARHQIQNQRSDIGATQHHFENTYTPVLNEAFEVAPNVQLINHTDTSPNSRYQSAHGDLPVSNFLLTRTPNGQRQLVDVVAAVRQENYQPIAGNPYTRKPSNEFTIASARLNRLDSRLSKLENKEKLTNSDQRKINRYTAEIRENKSLIESLELSSVRTPSSQAYRSNRTPEAAEFPAYHNPQETPSWSAANSYSSSQSDHSWPAEAQNTNTSRLLTYPEPSAEQQARLTDFENFAHFLLTNTLSQPTPNGSPWIKYASNDHLVKFNDNYANFNQSVQNELASKPDLRPFFESSPVLQQAKTEYETVVLPELLNRGIIPRFSEAA